MTQNSRKTLLDSNGGWTLYYVPNRKLTDDGFDISTIDKIEKTGWHVTKSEFVDAPLFDELPMALECKLISYDEETCRLVGEIVNVCADERILDENGKIDLNKFSPITYDPVHHTYRKIGDVVGKAFSDGVKLK